jgi:hypothetical protein
MTDTRGRYKRTAAWEALQLERKHYPWRVAYYAITVWCDYVQYIHRYDQSVIELACFGSTQLRTPAQLPEINYPDPIDTGTGIGVPSQIDSGTSTDTRTSEVTNEQSQEDSGIKNG